MAVLGREEKWIDVIGDEKSLVECVDRCEKNFAGEELLKIDFLKI